MDIREALAELDTLDDEVWTSDGAPKIDAVKELLGRPVTRQEILDAAPKFTRQNTDLDIDENPQNDSDQKIEQSQNSGDIDLSDALSVEPMDVNSFLKFLDRVPTHQLQELKDGLDTRRGELRDLRYKIDDFDRMLSGSLTMVKSRIQREIPDISDREAIQTYLKSQQDQRIRKKEFTDQVLKGIKLSDLDPRSPMDRAFARKTARGTQRPGT